MIPFFRQIRRKMADDKRFYRYAKYALGEILLVVIGILIALQINNWNEGRKLSAEEDKFYNNLKRQLLEDEKIIQNNIAYNDRFRKQYVYALGQLQANDRSHLDTLAQIAVNLLEYSDFHQDRNIYESLVISGQIKLLQNQEIVEGLQQLDELFVYINKLEDAHFEVVKVIYTDLNKIVRLQPLKVEDPEALFGFEFQNHLALSIDITTEKDEVYQNAIAFMDSLLKRIEREVGE